MVLLTIGIPMYNAQKYIEQTLKSLINQTYQDWVCLVSDNNSSDESLNIVKRYANHDKRFIVFEHKSQLGPANNWNYLVEQTNTEFIKILHADDILHPNNLEFSMKLINQYPKSVLVSSKRNFAIYPKNITLELKDKYIKFKVYNKIDVIKKLKFTNSNFIGEPSFVIFKTEYLKKIRGFSRRVYGFYRKRKIGK
jgi:glycosyltransferase involved in cell wall biosynthesis